MTNIKVYGHDGSIVEITDASYDVAKVSEVLDNPQKQSIVLGGQLFTRSTIAKILTDEVNQIFPTREGQ